MYFLSAVQTSAVLETYANTKGVLSQEQGDAKLHSIAYDNRSLSIQEKKYGITDMETLAVVVTSTTT